MKSKLSLITFLIAGVLLLGVTSTQCINRGYLFANIGTLFSWSGSAQAGWSGSTRNATCGDYATFIKNDGTPCGNSNTVLTDGYALAHAVNNTTHSPILSNNTFAAGLSPWTSANTGGCNGVTFSGQSASDQDGDNGYALASSSICNGTPAAITLAQSFSTGGVPTSQTYSFWYEGNLASSGSSACTIATGSVSLALVVNATTVDTQAAPILDGNWHHESGSMSAMVSGSNTITLTATLSAAQGQILKFQHGESNCLNASSVAQPIAIDDVVLTGVW